MLFVWYILLIIAIIASITLNYIYRSENCELRTRNDYLIREFDVQGKEFAIRVRELDALNQAFIDQERYLAEVKKCLKERTTQLGLVEKKLKKVIEELYGERNDS